KEALQKRREERRIAAERRRQARLSRNHVFLDSSESCVTKRTPTAQATTNLLEEHTHALPTKTLEKTSPILREETAHEKDTIHSGDESEVERSASVAASCATSSGQR